MNVHFLYGMLFLLSAGFYWGMLYLHGSTQNDMYLFLSRQLPGQLFYFILGAWVTEAQYTPWFSKLLLWIGVPCALGLFFPLGVLAGSLALAGTIFFFAFSIPVFHYPFKREDISYGLYIYHFPVIQCLVFYGYFNNSPWVAVVLSLVYTIILACLSWIFIEKPFIIKKHVYKLGKVANG
jgi:peptidoglycan/LPS O-acetylase OafA/YrhL